MFASLFDKLPDFKQKKLFIRGDFSRLQDVSVNDLEENIRRPIRPHKVSFRVCKLICYECAVD